MGNNAKKHYAWTILIACCLFNASALGLTNTNGLYFPSVCEELGCMTSELMLHTVVGGLVAAVCLLFVDKIYKKYDIKKILLIGTAFYQLSYFALALCNSVLAFCIVSVFTGIGLALIVYVPIPMLINNWFVAKKKTALSICMVCAGLSGILISAVLGFTIPAWGWRVSYVVRSVIALAMSIPAIIIVSKKPEDKGLKAYGADEIPDEKSPVKEAASSQMKTSVEDIRVKLIACVIIALIGNMTCGIMGMLPTFATNIGMGIAAGSILTSLAMVGNMGSKALIGPVMEKCGAKISSIGLYVCMTVGFGMIAIGLRSTTVIYISAIVAGFAACANTMVVPSLADSFAKGDEYVYVLAKCSSGTVIASSFQVILASAAYDITHDYNKVYFLYSMMAVLAIIIIAVVFRNKEGK